MMEITLNNRKEHFEQEQLTVNELLEIKKFTFKMLVVKINQKLIKKDEYDTALIQDGDDVMVLHLISGG
ncbi:MAG TPA: sulfur carrier protein ThiS [Bacteroidia bacterium]|nr:sulfur carrier protein ThiS [Bacteroidia bacterium]HRS59835.1 sulfur carrier protein ThiS [Bacteroidia bacterium]